MTDTASVQMTAVQIDLARHALGLDGRRKTSYRNHFVTGDGSTDFVIWQDMKAKGWAWSAKGSALSGGDPVFGLTRAGAELALMPGEKLDPEDFA